MFKYFGKNIWKWAEIHILAKIVKGISKKPLNISKQRLRWAMFRVRLIFFNQNSFFFILQKNPCFESQNNSNLIFQRNLQSRNMLSKRDWLREK